MLRNFNCIEKPLREQFIITINNILYFCGYISFASVTLGGLYLAARHLNVIGIFTRKYSKKYRTVIVNNVEDCALAVNELQKKCYRVRVLGMDCEWRSDKIVGTGRVALLQLATLDGYCFLFRLCKIGHVPKCLADILGDPSIIKTGVAVSSDAAKMLKDYGIKCGGCIDLRYMAKELNLAAMGLGKMSECYLGVELDKNWRIRCSDWEADALNDQQKQYAARDALMSVFLFQYFNNRYLATKYWWLKRVFFTDAELWDKTISHWCKYLNIGFSEKSFSWHQQNSSIGIGCLPNARRRRLTASGNELSAPPSSTNSRSYSTKAYASRQSPLYHNIFIQAPDGTVLCTCDQKKASWYLNKEIAEIVEEEPLTLRLKFEPGGKKGDGEGYYARVKKNVCVVCGSVESMRRKSIVPHEYRKYFPVVLKKHSSHDVLLLCNTCHCMSQFHDQQLRFSLAEECDAPLGDSDNTKFLPVEENVLKVRSAARAILKCSDTIPTARRSALESIIVDYLHTLPANNRIKMGGSENITHCCISEDECFTCQHQLNQLANLPTCVENVNYEPHGLKVVEHYKAKEDQPEAGVNLLEKLWRNNFVNCMTPKYLPELWSVDYNHYQPK